ncbi:MAG: PAS domain S-box protein [Planctomycetes bacterium]|nr:PAS domain S-box protein [Planctomycetota bacterium]
MGKLLHVLIIEDSVDDMNLLVRKLRHSGYELDYEHVETPQAMREALKKRAWDVIFSDYSMPHFSGPEALKVLRGSGIDTPFIIVSGTIGEEAAVTLTKAGVNDYLLKDNLSRLSSVIEREMHDVVLRRQQQKDETELRNLRKAIETSGDIVFTTDKDGIFTYINSEFTRVYGYTHDELIGKVTPRMLKSGLDQQEKYALLWQKILNKELVKKEFINKTKDGRIVYVDVSVNPILDDGDKLTGFLCIQRDITNRKHAENQQELVINIFEALNRHEEPLAVIRNILTMIKNYTGMEAAGIRICEDEDCPYFVWEGFNDDFIKAENHVCMRDTNGNIIRDEHGVPIMKCMCGKVIRAETDSSKPFFSQSGSFWTNSALELSANMAKEDHVTCAAHNCTVYGFESVALIPLRSGSRIAGLLHLSDRRKNCLSRDLMVFLEGIGSSIGISLTRKQAEADLELRARLLDAGTDSISLVDLNGRLLYANETMCKLLGYQKNELMLMNISDIDSQQTADMIGPRMKELIKNRNAIFEVEHKHKNGSIIPEEIHAHVIELNGKDVILSVSRDITERRMIEKEKMKLQEQFLQAQKMEAIGLLAGGVAHDFNNLLTTIKGFSELAMMKIKDTDPLYGQMNQINLAAERAANLTRKLLLFSRKQPMKLVPVNINKVIDELLKMLNRLIGEDIEIVTEFSPDISPFRADVGNIEQVIMNLAINSRDAMPDGGRLLIKTENAVLNGEESRALSNARKGRFVRLSIEDNGIGMTKEVLVHMFEPFFTTKGIGKGTGLGLSVVYGIIKQHDGFINVYSEPGQGTTFRIYFPAVAEQPREETKKQMSLQQLQGKGERILLIEDDKMVRNFAVTILEENGYAVSAVENAAEAINLFKKEKGKFDAIFSDVVLPDKNGIQLVEELLTIKSGIPVLFNSGYSDQKLNTHALKKIDAQFLQKPYTVIELMQVMRKILTR